MKQYILYTFLLVTLGFLPTQSFAQTACTPLFGGGETCRQHDELNINKEVRTPNGQAFRDNLTDRANYFNPGSTVTFRITIQNKSNGTRTNIKVEDILPNYLTYQSGNGTYDQKNRTFTASIDKLDKGQSRALTLIARISQAPTLPKSPTPLCLINQASVIQDNKIGSDNATVCIATAASATAQQQPTNQTTTKGGVVVTPTGSVQTTAPQSRNGLPVYNQPQQSQTPATGPGALASFGLLSSLFGGIFLRRRTSWGKLSN